MHSEGDSKPWETDAQDVMEQPGGGVLAEKQTPNFADYLYYDPTSPSGLRWKVDILSGRHKKRVNVAKDSPAGSRQQLKIKRPGWWNVSLCGRNYIAHRVVWKLVTGMELKAVEVIDHIDGDPSNNTFTNLRIVTPAINSRNLSKRRHNTSGVTGVSLNSKRQYWSAHWRDVHGKASAKTFSIITYGFDGAKEMAVAHRRKMIEDMNSSGAGYTERHGT